MICTVNPANGEVLGEHAYDSHERVDDKLHDSVDAGRQWGSGETGERVDTVAKLANALRHAAPDLARQLSLEMGKPVTAAVAEVEKAAAAVDYFCEQASEALAPDVLDIDGFHGEIRLRPLGPLLAVMPWNFPYWQTLRFALPALLVGNTILVKHSPVTTGTGALLQEVMQSVLPAGVFETVVIDDATVHTLIGDPRVRGVTLTGSTEAGRAIAASAGRAIKPVVLELGGSDPFVVLADAAVEAAARAAVGSRMQNSGQSCIAAKRFVVVEDVADQFTEAFCAAASALRVGDPLDAETDMGPLAGARFREEVHAQVGRAVEAGATVRLGCQVPDGPGYYYPPSVLTGVRADMDIAQSEVFGPVASIMVVADRDEAIRVANETPFGLAAAVWGDGDAGTVADSLEAGSIVINDVVRSDVRLPFGGVKMSGFGRELGIQAFSEFANIQTLRRQA